VLLTEVKERPIQRFVTGIVDANFGGGIPLDSVTLIAGKAGGGKSTLSIQLCDMIASVTNAECLYIAAEESGAQIKERAKRLALTSPHLIRLSPMGADNDIGEVIERRKPKAVILDSLPGFVTSDDEAVSLCNALKLFATRISAPFIVIDHINKADDFAGKEALQHAVDITMTLFPTGEGEQRELFTHKNRYGKAQVSSLFDMTEKGLVPSMSGLAPVDDEGEEDYE
jgi:DNA repair protein RadA/Sms